MNEASYIALGTASQNFTKGALPESKNMFDAGLAAFRTNGTEDNAKRLALSSVPFVRKAAKYALLLLTKEALLV